MLSGANPERKLRSALSRDQRQPLRIDHRLAADIRPGQAEVIVLRDPEVRSLGSISPR
jgi:hypothetical protein